MARGVGRGLNEELKWGSPCYTFRKHNIALKAAFHALTPGRQRAYNLHFSAAKQSATRQSRIAKCTPLILCGKGLNDCTCGLSKRMPQCDGSHKSIP